MAGVEEKMKSRFSDGTRVTPVLGGQGRRLKVKACLDGALKPDRNKPR